MPNHLHKKAIDAAINQRWSEAIELNLQILSEDLSDIAALNRLAKAYCESGNIDLAKKTYLKVLKLDKYNPVATKNITKLENHSATLVARNKSFNPNFIDIPGKTKTIQLLRLGDSKLLSILDIGEVVKVVPKRHCIRIYSQSDQYIGSIPDDTSFNLMKNIDKGSKFEAVIKSASNQSVSVFIKDTSPNY